jgi:ferritin
MEDAINKQINAELYSSYLYLSMAAWFESVNLPGFAKWMEVQAKEEHSHAMKFYKHVNERLGRVKLAAIDAPPTQWNSPLAAFQAVAAHEAKVTSLINALVDRAAKEKDYASNAMLQWFVTEQVEEEANADEIVAKLKMAGDSKGSLLVLDHHLGKRE